MRSAIIVAALLGFTLTVPAFAEPKAWNQEAVASIAKQLADAAGDLRQSVRRTTPPPMGAQRRLHFQALDDLRVIEGSINSLARQLAGGASMEETLPTFRRIGTLRNDIANAAQRANLTEPTISKLETARDLMQQLAPYYEGADAG